MTDFTMPSLGADMESAELVKWLVSPGQEVHRGDIIAIVETQKGAIDVEIFTEGTVAELVAAEGETVPVGGLLARIDSAGEAKTPPPSPTRPPPSPDPDRQELAPTLSAPAPLRSGARGKVTPAARRRATELGIDPVALPGTGVDGAVSYADVELARMAGRKPAAPPRSIRQGRFNPVEMRRAIAAAMARSKREIPHYYLSTTIDMAAALNWLAKYNAVRPPEERMLPAVLLLKASALALCKVPQLNGFWRGDAFEPGAGVHVGWAISLRGGGLIAPAIHDVDRLALSDLMGRLRDLVARARAGGLRSSEMMDATATITSLGDRGADTVTGIIHPPQVAILGFGRISERPWVADGQIAARPLIEVTLAADHRASDGHDGGLLLSAIETALQEPEKL